LEELRNAFAACEDATSLAEEQAKRMTPMRSKVSGIDWNTDVDLVRAELDRINAQ
jgi:hypothetical protein